MAGWPGDDFYTEREPGALHEVDEMILASCKAKLLPRLGPGASTEGAVLRRILRWSPVRALQLKSIRGSRSFSDSGRDNQ